MISKPDLDSDFDFSIIAEMRKAALETPLDPVAGIIPDQDLTTRDFEYGGYPIRVKMTLDKLADRWAWHISIGHSSVPTKLPDMLIESIASKFLPGERMEMPSMLHPGTVKQFIQLCDKKPKV